MIKSDSHSNSQFRVRVGLVALLGVAALLGAACASDDESADSGQSSDGMQTVLVTTSILGDVVSNLLGDAATVETLMPMGADPHEFQASAQQVEAMVSADVLVTNGAGFEEGLEQNIEAAEGVGTRRAASRERV